MPEFVACYSRIKLAIWIAIMLVAMLAGLWTIGMFGDPPQFTRVRLKTQLILGWPGITFFALGAIVIATRLMRSDVQLRINASGIYYARWSRDIIPWHEIADIWEYRVEGHRSMVLRLRHPERFRTSGLGRYGLAANRAMIGGDLSFTLMGMNRSFEEAAAAIRRFRNTERPA